MLKVKNVLESTFSERLFQSAEEHSSRLILALDIGVPLTTDSDRWSEKKNELLIKAHSVLDSVIGEIAAVKINNHLLLPLGLFDGLQEILAKIKGAELPIIYDAKISDIGSTNTWISKHLFDAGFDAVICNPFIGWDAGLEPIFKEAYNRHPKAGVILLIYMSHPGAEFGFGATLQTSEGTSIPFYNRFAKLALKQRADGVIVGATFPQKIQEIKSLLESKIPIISPGVGAQGGDASKTMQAGADFIITGRVITTASNPGDIARKIRKSIKTN